ncbi:MAG: 1-(5-phosphoribosyl)-5-amino-4-imidazole-carboxylate carboxylase, partial [Cyanobacteria bacterium J06649_4]
MSESESVLALMEAVAKGEVSPAVAAQQVSNASQRKSERRVKTTDEKNAYKPVGDFAKIDHDRADRTGFPEVIWGQDKSATQIVEIMRVMALQQQVVMATRIDSVKADAIKAALPQVTYFEMARICAILPTAAVKPHPGRLSILTAGTADLPVAEEAAVTAELCGFTVTRLWDVGVAG